MSLWTIRVVQTIRMHRSMYAGARKHILRAYETSMINRVRDGGADLLQGNNPVDTNTDRAAYMREWRRRNPGYMAMKSRQWRERRRAELERLRSEEQQEIAAINTAPETTQTSPSEFKGSDSNCPPRESKLSTSDNKVSTPRIASHRLRFRFRHLEISISHPQVG